MLSKIGVQYVFETNLNEPICQILNKIVLFVYSNIVEYGFVEDAKSKLLISFTNMQRLKKNALSSIQYNDL